MNESDWAGERNIVAPSGEQRVSKAASRAARLHAHLLKLYPRRFQDTFAEEMGEVFTLTVADAAQQGTSPVISLILREFVDLPVNLILAHVHERPAIRSQVLRRRSAP